MRSYLGYKIRVWSPVLKHWKTVYARSEASLKVNVALLHSYGFTAR